MLKKLLPHRWIPWLGLQVICLIIFYIALVVGIYALWKGIFTFFDAADIQARRLYVAALLQALILCTMSGTLFHVLKACARVSGRLGNLTPKK